MATLRLSNGCRHQVCGTCLDALYAERPEIEDDDAADVLPYADEHYSGGVYAGVYCDTHWRSSGYRDLPHIIGGMTADEIEARDYADEDD